MINKPGLLKIDSHIWRSWRSALCTRWVELAVMLPNFQGTLFSKNGRISSPRRVCDALV